MTSARRHRRRRDIQHHHGGTGYPAVMPDNAPLTPAQLAITAAALDGDPGSIYDTVRALMAEGWSLESVLLDAIAPAQASLGDRWSQGDYLIADEHVATAAIETVVAMLAGSFDQPEDGRHAVVACVEGDAHSLAGRMLSALLVSRGYRAAFVGAGIPASDLAGYLAADPPELLVLTCAMKSHLPGALASIAAGKSVGATVVVGGPAFGAGGEWAIRLGADRWVPDLRSAGDFIDEISPGESTSPTDTGEAAALVADRAAILGTAAALASDPGQSARFADDLGGLFDAMVAANVVGAPGIIRGYVDWLAQRHGVLELSPDTVGRLVASMLMAVGAEFPVTAGWLAELDA